MTYTCLRALVGATLLCAFAAPAAAETCATPSSAAQPAKPKKKGLGFGGLLKAAKNAGVGDMLGGGMLGNGTTGQIAGAVAGTAVNAAADGSGSGMSGGMMMPGSMMGLAGSGRAAQIAGAVTGTAAELARTSTPAAAPAVPCTPAQ
jgi:uncharacterized protein YfiM (DUF2279 family)